MAAVLLLAMNQFSSANNHVINASGYKAMIPSLPALPQEDDFLCGDVNEDGLVNVLDIISMVNYIMGGNPSPFNQDAADINADSGINVLDVIALVNIIMQVPGLPCGCVAPVLYEGQTYTTVWIGGQCWFKENMNVGTMISGTIEQSNNGTIEKYCFDDNISNCDTYGGLYQWNEAMQYGLTDGAQGICPPGWHIPGDNEIKILEGTSDSQFPAGDPVWNIDGWRGSDVGGNLKEEGTAHWIVPNTGATNFSGFTGLPGGIRNRTDGSFSKMGENGFFWSSRLISAEKSWARKLSYLEPDIERIEANRLGGFSIRCVKDCSLQPTQANAGPDQSGITGTSATLAGNTPAIGTGQWYILTGIGGTIVSSANPASQFQGLVGQGYTLTWRISTDCTSTEDTVFISFAPSGPICPGLPTVMYDGQTYTTVLIGDQCWFRENLNVGTMIEETNEQSNNGTIEKYCYDDNISNCNIYGGLYQWNEAMQYVENIGAGGICPYGWHIPTGIEWNVLTDLLGGSDVAGGKLKTTGTYEDETGLWFAPNTGATNESGFSALPGGYRMSGGGFNSLHAFGPFWSSVKRSTGLAWYRSMASDNTSLALNSGRMNNGFSIRCIIDCWPLPSQSNAGPDQLNISGTSTILAGNTPDNGTGLWEIVGGTGGTIVNPSSPTSEFQGLAGMIYSLAWTISTTCGNSADTVVISFAPEGFSCGTDLIDDRDGQIYSTVQIGSQCWMKQSLNVGTMITGTIGQSNNGTIEKYCFDNSLSNCGTYGGLYQWNEAMQYVTTEGTQGICPAGWHLPTDNEWKNLEGEVDSQYPFGHPVWDEIGWRGSDAGGNLKEAGTEHWNAPNTGATNSSGFTALPGGYRYFDDADFDDLGSDGIFWSSSQTETLYVWIRQLGNDDANVNRDRYFKENGFSVRCLKDCQPQPSQADAGSDQAIYGTSTTLAGNTPASGSGLWQIISGTGGTVTDPTNPASGFQGLVCTTYTLSWTVSTECGSTSDIVGISLAPDVSFTCGDMLQDCRDGQSYETVQIGDQCWMAENLNIGTMIFSTTGGYEQTNNGIIEKFCYNNTSTFCDTYGGLYEWPEAMGYETNEGAYGICPIGWHLPTDYEVKVLEGTVDSQYGVGAPEWDKYGLRGFDAGGNLKEAGTTHWSPPNTGATNSSGFTALPGGLNFYADGSFFSLGEDAIFWTSSQGDPYLAWIRGLYHTSVQVDRSQYYMHNGFSVRCLKNL